MGVTWIADVISWAVGGPHYLWYVTDFINAIQGVFIFIVVGCQPQVRSIVCLTFNNRRLLVIIKLLTDFVYLFINNWLNRSQIWAAVKRLWSSKTERNMNNTTNGPQHSSSSHGLPSMGGGESITNNTFTNTTSTTMSNNTHSVNNNNNISLQNTKIPLETVCWRKRNEECFWWTTRMQKPNIY